MDQISTGQIKTNVIQFNSPKGGDNEPLRPRKFIEFASAFVVIAHVLFFASFIQLMPVEIGAPDAINAELVNEGDFFNSEAIAESEEVPEKKQVEEEENPDQQATLEKPLLKNPDAEIVKEKKEEEKNKEKSEDKTDSRAPSQAREAQVARRAGAPDRGGAKVGGGSKATCLTSIATSLRRRLPGATKLGKGWAHVSFNIIPGGDVSDISVSASTPAHAALARRIISGVRGANSCGAEFVSQHISFD